MFNYLEPIFSLTTKIKEPILSMISLDVTLFIQIINTFILFFLFVGIPIVVMMLFKSVRRKDNQILELKSKVDDLSKRLDDM